MMADREGERERERESKKSVLSTHLNDEDVYYSMVSCSIPGGLDRSRLKDILPLIESEYSFSYILGFIVLATPSNCH